MAPPIPQAFINDLLERIDIVEVIDARVTLKKAGKDYQALCPFHDEKTPSFSVVPDKQFYYCFGCGKSGTALTFLLEYDGLDFVAAVEALATMAGVEVPRQRGPSTDTRSAETQRSLDALAQAARYYQKSLKQAPHAIEYLKGRGLTGEVARDFLIGYAPSGWNNLEDDLPGLGPGVLIDAGLSARNERGKLYDRFRDRIMFPIRDTRGRVIAFGGRLLDGDGPKYLNSPETALFHKNREVYGLFEARQALRQIDRFLLVEGYMDVVALARVGIANAVATLGTACGEDHLDKLFRYSSEVVCCFDGDNAGRQAAWRALERALGLLKDGRQLKFMFLPDGEDPDSLVGAEGPDAFLARLAQAVPAAEYLFAQLGVGIDLKTLDGRARLADLAGPYIERVPTGALQALMRSRLAELTGVTTPARREPPRTEKSRKASPNRLAEYVLTTVVGHPELVARLRPEQRAALMAENDLIGDLVRFVADQAGLTTADVLGHWSGEPAHEELIRLLERPQVLTGEQLVLEFLDAVSRYINQRSRQARARLLRTLDEDALDQNASDETFRRYWSLRRHDASDPEVSGQN